MLNSIALDVVIGLIFIYLLYSLLATTINEAIASLFSLRAQKLEKAIIKMLDDGVMSHHNFWNFLWDVISGNLKKIKKLMMMFSFKRRIKTKIDMTLFELFYDHPAIKYLGENKISNKPSYISADFFSKALIDVLKEKAGDPDANSLQQLKEGIAALTKTNETRQLIQSLLRDSNYDLEKFKASIEIWYNETMNRASGWYKRQAQKITFIIGFVLAISFNVDTISIVKKLSNDKNAAKALGDLASKYVETHKDSAGHLSKGYQDTAGKLFADAKKQLDGDISNANSIIGLGWTIPGDTSFHMLTKNALNTKADSVKCVECLRKIIKRNAYNVGKDDNSVSGFFKETWNMTAYTDGANIKTLGKIRYVICMAFSSGRRLMGYLLTALAISFGAPFWFDLLNKLVQLRTSGKKPDQAGGSGGGNEESKTKIKTVG